MVKHATQKDPDSRFQTTVTFQAAIDDMRKLFCGEVMITSIPWVVGETGLPAEHEMTLETTDTFQKKFTARRTYGRLLWGIFAVVVLLGSAYWGYKYTSVEYKRSSSKHPDKRRLQGAGAKGGSSAVVKAITRRGSRSFQRKTTRTAETKAK